MNVFLDERLRQIFKDIRLKAGLTQKDVAKKLGRPQTFVSKYELGERRLGFSDVVLLCEIFEIHFLDFVREFESEVGRNVK